MRDRKRGHPEEKGGGKKLGGVEGGESGYSVRENNIVSTIEQIAGKLKEKHKGISDNILNL